MPDSFDAYQFLNHLRGRWRVLALAPLAAGAIALVASLLLPKQYTATAKLLILPPGSHEPRSSTAVSPVYLESLRTFEHLALSDSLFKRAVEELEIDDSDYPKPLSSLKRSALQVEVPRHTKVLEIRATLRDPEKAHALASYIAEETVRINQEANEEADRANIEAFKGLLSITEQRVEKATKGLTDEDKGRVRGQTEAAEDIQGTIDRLAELVTAWWAYDEAEQRMADAKSVVAARGERLQVIDPGVVPERPSSPKIPLNTVAGLLFGLVLAFGYVTVEFAVQQRKAESRRRELRLAGHG